MSVILKMTEATHKRVEKVYFINLIPSINLELIEVKVNADDKFPLRASAHMILEA